VRGVPRAARRLLPGTRGVLLDVRGTVRKARLAELLPLPWLLRRGDGLDGGRPGPRHRLRPGRLVARRVAVPGAPGAGPRWTPITDVCVITRDLARAIEFYTGPLGLTLDHRMDGFADFRGMGIALAVWQADHLRAHTGVPAVAGRARTGG